MTQRPYRFSGPMPQAVSYVDIHTHLTHEKFSNDLEKVIESARVSGVNHVVVNGLEPKSNRTILQMSQKYSNIWPALGIYPLDAVCSKLPADFPFKVDIFDVDQEIEFIRSSVKSGLVAAVGECGLDQHYVDQSLLGEQERVFRLLIEVAKEADIPIIIHTRKAEQRAADILAEHGVRRVNFHCFGGKTSLAKRLAETYGWCFSIPANSRVSESFQKMLRTLPEGSILTETDAPYLAPVRGQRNEPKNVLGTVDHLAELRGWTVEQARAQVANNFQELFKASS